MIITIRVEHLNPARPTIYTALKAKLGREPSNAELKAEVQRILREGNERK